MKIDRETIVPYTLATLVVLLVLGLIGIDVWGALPKTAKANGIPTAWPQAEQDGITDLVLFDRVTFKNTVVETGHQYASPRDKAPSKQWCHVLGFTSNQEAGSVALLGEARGAEPVKWRDLTEQVAAEFGFSSGDIKDVRDKCRFINVKSEA